MGCVFPVVFVTILPPAEFGPNDHREDAPHINCNNPISIYELKSFLIWSNRFQFSKIRLALIHFHHLPNTKVNFAFFGQWIFESIGTTNRFSNATILLNFEELQMIPNFPALIHIKDARLQPYLLSFHRQQHILVEQSADDIHQVENRKVQRNCHQ